MEIDIEVLKAYRRAYCELHTVVHFAALNMAQKNPQRGRLMKALRDTDWTVQRAELAEAERKGRK